MTALEKLARRICWLGFSRGGRKGNTEAGYWKKITQAARDGYMIMAAAQGEIREGENCGERSAQ